MPDSQKRERATSARLMRAQGRTWVEIAEFFRTRYHVNARVAVRAYIADNQADHGRSALDVEYAALQTVEPDAPISRCWYFYGEPFYWSTYAQFALKLEKPETTIAAVDKSLAWVNPVNLHERAHRSLFRAEAHIQQDAVVEACTMIGDVAQLTAISQPERLDQRISDLRTALRPWERTKPVRELDDRLKTYRAVNGGGTKSRS